VRSHNVLSNLERAFCSLMTVKRLVPTACDQIAAAITWAVNGGAHVISMSPGNPDPMPHTRPIEDGPRELVHFAGHSHFAGTEGQEMGCVFVPRRNPLDRGMPLPQAVGITKMAAWLKGAGFVFLGGCSSSHREFVYHLCARNVPAMSGYPWPVLDRIAWQHAAHFYRRLLDTRSIEKALQLSWLDMYAEHGDAWAWASSRFVIQDAA
jgi:hypothetical protein